MKIFSINPNTNKYFVDTERYYTQTCELYQGIYSYTPVYPRYTFSINGRFNYTNTSPEIEFVTMLPIKRMMRSYLVEIRYRFVLNVHANQSIEHAISQFNSFCENMKKTIDINSLPT